jgi:hypothetical protein
VYKSPDPLILFRNVQTITDKILQIKATCNVTVASNTCWNGTYSALSTDSYFAVNSSDSQNSNFDFDSGNYKTVNFTEGSLYVNEIHSNKVFCEDVEFRNITLAGTFSFDSGTTSFYKQYGQAFNCNTTGGGSVKNLNLYFFDTGYYKCSVLFGGNISGDVNTSCWFDMVYDGSNAQIYNVLNTGFSWSITNVSNNQSINISCQYNSNYTTFSFFYWKTF